MAKGTFKKNQESRNKNQEKAKRVRRTELQSLRNPELQKKRAPGDPVPSNLHFAFCGRRSAVRGHLKHPHIFLLDS
jgi:hypothetical protein